MTFWRWGLSLVCLTAFLTWAGLQNSAVAGGQKKEEPKKTEPKKDEPKKTEPKKEEPKKEEPKKEEPKKTEPKKEEPKQPAPGNSTFSWKAFEKGAKPFYQKLTTKTEQSMKVMGQDIKQTQEQTFFLSWTPKDPVGGNWVVTQKIEGVVMAISIGGAKFDYDSRKNNPANPMKDFFDNLLKAQLTYTVDPKTMTVTKIEGAQELIKSLGGTNPQMENLLRTLLNEDALKQMADPTWGAFPTKAVNKGDSWNRESKLNLGNIGTYDTKFTYTYAGAEKGMEKIDIKTSLAYAAPSKEAKDAARLPFTIKEVKNQGKNEGSGSAWFDPKAGRFAKVETKMDLSLTLVIEVGNVETEVVLNQTQNAIAETSESNYLSAAK